MPVGMGLSAQMIVNNLRLETDQTSRNPGLQSDTPGKETMLHNAWNAALKAIDSLK